ncbi:DNA topoisomerase I [Candidatus Woesearchaeota archaeon]|nr:DNA topoisomerase I [Candidatus Woesearchaeota archaeon]
MGYELIVTEKPSQAKKIAESLADGKPLKKSENGVPYYVFSHKGTDLVAVSAVGHVYSLMEKEKSYKYPSYDIAWKEAYAVDKNSAHTKKYINVIKKLAKDAEKFIVATDFDVEGEVIGLNVIRFACKQKDAQRMKFSTLTKPDLIKAFENRRPHIEWGQANAGETRHFLDWMYGINVSRALSIAIRKAGLYKSLSSGRVQGPALKLIVDKEKEIRAFVPTPYWQIPYSGQVNGNQGTAILEAMHAEEKIWEEEKAKKIFEKINNNDGVVKAIDKNQTKSQPPTPFDLTTLQTESFRSLKISPKETLAIAQELYSNGWISYPRTSSQQLPPELEYEKLLKELLRHPYYKPLAEEILTYKPLKPNNGKKTDPAHPAIHPTGILPDETKLKPRELKIYDLVVRRFLATFAKEATRETNKITFEVKEEKFIAKGTRTIDQGWFKFYGPHVKLEEEELPILKTGDSVIYKEAKLESKETKPPKRFTPASLIKELEKRNLGTKATRAAIIDTLFQRGYVLEKSLEPTEIGIKTSDTLEKHVPDIVKEDLTRDFEDEMELIREEKSTKDKVLDKAKIALSKILGEFQAKEKEIGKNLKESLFESQEKENTIGECPKCKEGTLMIKYSPKTKQYFLGCSNYPDCTALFGLPGTGKGVKAANKNCESCGYPMVIMGTGRNQRTLCINMDCSLKKQQEEDTMNPVVKELLKKPCPNCGSAMTLRKSMYGEFLGCSGYPKCKTIIQIPKNEGEQPKVIDYNNRTTTKKTTKKTSKKSTKKSTKKTTKKITKK